MIRLSTLEGRSGEDAEWASAWASKSGFSIPQSLVPSLARSLPAGQLLSWLTSLTGLGSWKEDWSTMGRNDVMRVILFNATSVQPKQRNETAMLCDDLLAPIGVADDVLCFYEAIARGFVQERMKSELN